MLAIIVGCVGAGGCQLLDPGTYGGGRSSARGSSGIRTITMDDQQSGAAAGAGLTGVAIMVAGESGSSWAPIALAGGAALGYVVGEVIEDKREQMIRDREFVEQELAETDAALERIRQRNEALKQAVAGLNQSVLELEARGAKTAAEQDKKRQTIEVLDEALKVNEVQAQRIRDAITYLETMRTESEVLEGEDLARLDRQLTDLRTNLAALEGELDALASLKVRAGSI